MPLGQNAKKLHPDPEIIGDVIEVHQSTSTNSNIRVHIVDVGGNSCGTFEFDRTAQVFQIKEELALPDDQRANLVFLDIILDDNLTLEHAGLPTETTLTVVITMKTLSERVRAILAARQMQTPEAEPLTSETSRLHGTLYCFAALPVVNDVLHASGIWMSLFSWKLSHLLLMIDMFISICGMAILKYIVQLNHHVPRANCLCGCSCPPYILLAFGTWHLVLFLLSFYRVSIALSPSSTERVIENGEYQISEVFIFGCSSTAKLAFGSYWRNMNSRCFENPNPGTSIEFANGHFT
eukprot:gnl/MRDRNA2_/MRDRNA2_97499_c0_seq1.p1 gnl/MRDRNA2_/MRDRNA2_97499_c0~~gnl/MRDRNA2_/MRDRNA2_97499_c0_seq1.p1  ORF type:complete len:294 (+),score=34.44 gnl/MRDRNA2_/MRDRNA2_97499_c0_seq1:124-1005(+)